MKDAFDELAAQLDYPMTIVTTAANGERSGCLVGFTTQCSMKPARYLICISKANHTYDVADQAESLVVHFPTDDDHAIAELFGEKTGDDVDKFAQCEWRDGPGGAPILDAVGRWFAGPILAKHDMGDHVGFVVDVADAAVPDAAVAGPLTFQDVKDMPPGHPV